MRSIWKGTISFGLVNIPIALGIATQRSDPSFRTLDRETSQPIRQQLFSPARGEPISREETVKGYEVSKDRYVVITDEELETVSVERRRTIDIAGFVAAEEIDPVYYDRTYYVDPQENAERPYALLLEAMRESGKVALGKIVLSNKEHLALLRPSDEVLVIELLFYPEDVRSKAEIEEKMREIELKEDELQMAQQLVESMARAFDPGEFQNEHKRDLLALVERKLEGEEITAPPEAPTPAPVPDLMSALKASLEDAKAGKRTGATVPADSAEKTPAGSAEKASSGKGSGGKGSGAKGAGGTGAGGEATSKGKRSGGKASKGKASGAKGSDGAKSSDGTGRGRKATSRSG